MLGDGIDQGANGLHDAQELLIWDQKGETITLRSSDVLNNSVIK